MRRFVLLTFLPVVSFAADLVVPPLRTSTTEFNIQFGVADYREDYLGKTWFARAGFDYRVKYPFLLGAGLYLSSSSDVWITSNELRAKVRIPVVSTLKLDPYFGMQVGYAENKVLNKKKYVGGGVVGLDVLYFLSGVHFGLSGAYSIYTDSRFDHIRVGFVVGF
ncbi:MAG: hypothetical protein QW228_07295 [Candidatus Aenigmatarchaeota archaeon]